MSKKHLAELLALSKQRVIDAKKMSLIIDQLEREVELERIMKDNPAKQKPYVGEALSKLSKIHLN